MEVESLGRADMRERVYEIKRLHGRGAISYETAKKMMKPYLDEVNRRGKEIASNHGMKYRNISMAEMLR